MASWPPDWITRSLAAADIEADGQAISIMRAWKNSVPLPPLSNNPLGFPVGTLGAPGYLGTRYAIFPSMAVFYRAFGVLTTSALGRPVAAALRGHGGYPAAWRAISALPWPARDTETDWPAAVLDLTAASYRRSIGAAAAAARTTSGTVGGDAADTTSASDVTRVLLSSVANAKTALDGTRARIVNGGSYG